MFDTAALVSVAARRSGPGSISRDTTQEERDAALLEQTGCGTSGPTSGLLGYVDGEPAGWVAVEPRENYPRIWARQKAWMRMDPELEGVWSVTCFVVRKGFRRQGLMTSSPQQPSSTAAGRCRVLEGYPTEPTPGKTVIWDEASVGLLQVFIDAGYEVEASPTLRRRVVRHDSAQRPDARFCPNRHLLEAGPFGTWPPSTALRHFDGGTGWGMPCRFWGFPSLLFGLT